MINQLPPELFAQRPVRSSYAASDGGFRIAPKRLALLIGLGAALVLGGLLANYMISDNLGVEADGQLPQITADGPVKERPAQPGGIDIPHQDMAVFQQLDGQAPPASGGEGGAEQLLPPPEEPQIPTTETPRSDSLESPVTSLPPDEESSLPPAVTEAISEPAIPAESVQPAPKEAPKEVKIETKSPVLPPKTAEKEVKTPPKEAQKPAKEVKKQAESAIKKPETAPRLPQELFTTGEVPTAKAAASAPTGRMMRTQLGSHKDEATAQKEAARLQAKYASVLGGAKLSVVRADLGAKGIYYRVMSSPMDESTAKEACATLAAQKVNCMAVR